MNSQTHILILGIDGYIGYPLALDLLSQGYTISGLDNYSRRERVASLGSDSITPIQTVYNRHNFLKSYENFKALHMISILDYQKLLSDPPNIIIHLAEQPSAAWSMIDESTAIQTHMNTIENLQLLWQIKSHCPNSHLIKLGTMGEYGKPNCAIPEGFIPKQPCSHIKYDTILTEPKQIQLKKKCPMHGLPFPKSPNSFYHLTKVHDSNNILFACKTWGLSCTDIMQGVVFGLTSDHESHLTRFDYDECFGTVINRFCAQAVIGHPLTVYGSGNQSYSFLPLTDSIKCIDLILNNPPSKGQYRVLNQFGEVYSINLLANLVHRIAKSLNLNPSIDHIPNPRSESEDHIYTPSNSTLKSLGYEPSLDLETEITRTMKILLKYKSRINPKVIIPKITWR